MARTPIFTVRMSLESQRNLSEMAKVYGSSSVSGFAREVLETVSSGDVERVRAFTLRMAEKAGEQLKLSLMASFDDATQAQKPAKQARKLAGHGKPALKRRKA